MICIISSCNCGHKAWYWKSGLLWHRFRVSVIWMSPFWFVPRRLKDGSVLAKTQGAFSAKRITVWGNAPTAKNIWQSMKGVHFALLAGSAQSWRGTCCLLRKHGRSAHLCSAECPPLHPTAAPCSSAWNLQLSQHVVLLSCLMEGFGHHSFTTNTSIIFLLKHLS